MGVKGSGGVKKLDSQELEQTLFTVNSQSRGTVESLTEARTILAKMQDDDTLNENLGDQIKDAAHEALKAVDNIMANVQLFSNSANKMLEGYFAVAKKQDAAQVRDGIKSKASEIASKG